MFKCWTLLPPSQVQCSFGYFHVCVQGYLTLSLPANCLPLTVFRMSNLNVLHSVFIPVFGILYIVNWSVGLSAGSERGFCLQFIRVKLKWRLVMLYIYNLVPRQHLKNVAHISLLQWCCLVNRLYNSYIPSGVWSCILMLGYARH